MRRVAAVTEAMQDNGAMTPRGPAPIPQSPADWLLARYDRVRRRSFGPQGDGSRMRYDRGSNFDRNLVELIDDHPGEHCEAGGEFDCLFWSGEANWPAPSLSDDLAGEPLYELFEQSA